MKWSRILIGGILVEVATAFLRIVLISASDYFVGRGPGNELNPMFIAFFSETVGTALFAVLFGWWATRKNDANFLLAGLLIGIVANAVFAIDLIAFQVPYHPTVVAQGIGRIVFVLLGATLSLVLSKILRRNKLQ